jgi:hypothetical protein
VGLQQFKARHDNIHAPRPQLRQWLPGAEEVFDMYNRQKPSPPEDLLPAIQPIFAEQPARFATLG